MYLLDVSEAAVRHWQRNDPNFPKTYTKAWFPEDHLTLYNIKEIKEWLKKHKKYKKREAKQ